MRSNDVFKTIEERGNLLSLPMGGDNSEKRLIDEEALNDFGDKIKDLISVVSKRSLDNEEKIKVID